MESKRFTDYPPKIQQLDVSKMVINQKNDNDITTCRHDNIAKFFWHCFLLSSLVTGPSFMSISSLVLSYDNFPSLGMDQKSRNILVWVLPNLWRLVQVRDIRFGTNVSHEMLLNAAKCQAYSFYCFWEFKEKPTEGVGSSPFPPRIELKTKKAIMLLSDLINFHQLAKNWLL